MNDRFDFDALARNVAHGLTRREAFRRLGLGLAAGLLAELIGWFPAAPTPAAQAAATDASVSACFPETVAAGSLGAWLNEAGCLAAAAVTCPGCFAPAVCCGNACVSLQSDANNCGSCGTACTQGTTCVNGQCVCANGGSLGDNNNCLTCGHVCTSPNPYCDPFGVGCGPCPAGQGPCGHGGKCVDVLSDVHNCGFCGNVCPAPPSYASGTACVSGRCVFTNPNP